MGRIALNYGEPSNRAFCCARGRRDSVGWMMVIRGEKSFEKIFQNVPTF